MQLSLNWIKDFTDFTGTLQEFVDGMTLSGSKVETFFVEGEDISNVVTGKIITLEKHPDADRLVICRVEVGEDEPYTIVTGAPNVAVGQIVPVALPGAKLAGGLEIKASKLRGVMSYGMMCSVEELGFTRQDFPDAPENGIYVFPEDTAIGIDAKEALNIGNEVIEFEITSNRPDCYSVEGLAREAAVTFHEPFRPFAETPRAEADIKTTDTVKVTVKDPVNCPRYMARLVTDVKIGPSPQWLRTRLRAGGVRSINNIVDITNYVMLTLGNPLHAFDLNDVAGKEIIVRPAEDGEEIITLDDQKHTLHSHNLVIADHDRAVALAGVMGAENSEVKADTRTVLFEAANFNPMSVRRTAKEAGIRSESSLRFEKGLPPQLTERALDMACVMVEKLGCGKVSPDYIDVAADFEPLHTIRFSVDGINGLIGLDLPAELMLQILEELGIDIEKTDDSDIYVATVPVHRPDLQLQADLAEEVVRIYGYDEIPDELSGGTTPTLGRRNRKQTIVQRLHKLATGAGAFEICTSPFSSPGDIKKLGLAEADALAKQIVINNPLGEETSRMRSTMLPEFLRTVALNVSRGTSSGMIYEIAKTYHPRGILPIFTEKKQDEQLPDEREHLTILKFDHEARQTADLFYDVKGIVEKVLDMLGITGARYVRAETEGLLHPGQSCAVFLPNYEMPIGYIGTVHPQVAENFDTEPKTVVADLWLDALIGAAVTSIKFKPLPKYPAVTRDLALVMDKDALVKDVERVITETADDILETVKIFDVYRGKGVAEGKKSVAYSLIFRSAEGTLNDDRVDAEIKRILKRLEAEDIVLRDL